MPRCWEGVVIEIENCMAGGATVVVAAAATAVRLWTLFYLVHHPAIVYSAELATAVDSTQACTLPGFGGALVHLTPPAPCLLANATPLSGALRRVCPQCRNKYFGNRWSLWLDRYRTIA